MIDNEARIQERMEELQRNRENQRKPRVEDPARAREIESLELARKELTRSLESVRQPARRNQLTAALADIERRIGELQNKS